MHCVQKKITCLAWLPGISSNSNENYRHWPITFRLLLIFSEISGKFPEILNFRKTYNPTNDLYTANYRTVLAWLEKPYFPSVYGI